MCVLPDKLDNQNPLVSVIIPTYNRADCVARAIDSVLRQTYSNIEAVVVDDGSRDETAQVINTILAQDSRVRYSTNINPKGCGGARNTGLSIAAGDYIAFLDDDDEYLPGKIQAELNVFLFQPRIDVVVSGVPAEWCREGNRGIGWIELEFQPNRIFDGCKIMFTRTVMENIKFRYNYMEWRDIAFQIYKNKFNVFLLSSTCYRKNSVPNSLSKQHELMLTQALDNARYYYENTNNREGHEIFKHYLANCYKNIANYHFKKGHWYRSFRNYLQAFQEERKIRNLIPFQ